MKKFNITGLCIPGKHYMVDISGKIKKIMTLIDDECYFTINRGRQYGKTTTLHALETVMPDEYICVSISFEGAGDIVFGSENGFCQYFLNEIAEKLESIDLEFASSWRDGSVTNFAELKRRLNDLCRDKKIVLLIDEVDATSSNRVFLRFLGVLRNKFLERHRAGTGTFHSVILAGVYDIKTIKLKLAQEGVIEKPGDFERSYNSPWNIATEFDVEMSFSPQEISTILAEYEADHHTGMDIPAISEEIYNYTSGYPVLVSKLCKCMAELGSPSWTAAGVKEAVKDVISKKSVLFDDIFKNLGNDKRIHDFLYDLLIVGSKIRYSHYNPDIEWCNMFGYVSQDALGDVKISNKIFESVMLNFFSSTKRDAARVKEQARSGLYHEIVNGDTFNMELCLRKFAEHYAEVFTPDDFTYLERHGRLVFLSYLKPLINGQGFFHIESQLTDLRRMDVIVDFGREQFIIELKLWRGEKAQDKAYTQLLGYLDSKQIDKGYLLTFDLRKEKNKERKSEWIQVGGREIFEVVV